MKEKDRLRVEDIAEGMKVKASQLYDILDTYIILRDAHLVKNNIGIGTFEGIIDRISKVEVRITKPNCVLIYNDSYEREEYCEYE